MWQSWKKLLRQLFARKVVLVVALILIFVVLVAAVFPWVSDADPSAISISTRWSGVCARGPCAAGTRRPC